MQGEGCSRTESTRYRWSQAFLAPRRRCCGCFGLRTGVLWFASIFGALSAASISLAVVGPGYRFKTVKSIVIFAAVSAPQLLGHLTGLLAAHRRSVTNPLVPPRIPCVFMLCCACACSRAACHRMRRLAKFYHYMWVLLIFWCATSIARRQPTSPDPAMADFWPANAHRLTGTQSIACCRSRTGCTTDSTTSSPTARTRYSPWWTWQSQWPRWPCR